MDKQYFEFMAKFNKWANNSMNEIIKTLTDDQWKKEYSGFYKSIQEICSHIYFSDHIGLNRFKHLRNFSSLNEESQYEKYMEKKSNLVQYFWQIIYAHTIAYWIAGVIAFYCFNYQELWATEAMSAFYRNLNDPIVALGPVTQIIRGIIIALILLPLRKTFFEEKYGLIKLGLIIFGFSVISTYGAAISSFEGFIHLKVPFKDQILGFPEAIIWLSLFIGILYVSIKYSHKKIITILSIIIVLLICLMGIMGFMNAKGLITV